MIHADGEGAVRHRRWKFPLGFSAIGWAVGVGEMDLDPAGGARAWPQVFPVLNTFKHVFAGWDERRVWPPAARCVGSARAW